jgi:large subunit ribosomal protein L3
MAISLMGKKCGNTRMFSKDGLVVPITIVFVEKHTIVQLKNKKIDGYNAIQLSCGNKLEKKLTKPMIGHYKKYNLSNFPEKLWESRISQDEIDDYVSGMNLDISMFEIGQKLSVTGISKGKGFAGTVKRWHFAMQDATHGNSRSHRSGGSTGQNQTPGRVFKGKKMPGRLGGKSATVINLTLVDMDINKGLLIIKGNIPGAKNQYVKISRSN